MRTSADAIVGFKEYPHTDLVPRALELYRILVDTALGRVRPTTAVFDCRMVGIWHTTKEPMASFVKRMQSFEGQAGVLSVSLGHGFPWGDVADNGARLWVVTDNDLPAAQGLANQLGREFYDLREATRSHPLGVDAALDQALAIAGGPIVLADIADNAGGGAPADSTFILQRVLERGIGNAVLGPYWDLGAVHICRDAGVGAVIDLRVGGKCGPVSGWPVDLRVTVRAIVADHAQDVFGMRWPLGPSVWVETANGVSLLLTSVRSQAYGTDTFTGLGITLHDKKLVVVKSTQHFHAKFAPLAKAVFYVDTPGAITQDFANIAFMVRSLNYWPRVSDPWASQG
jgi:microcystin degradation protein MlrC